MPMPATFLAIQLLPNTLALLELSSRSCLMTLSVAETAHVLSEKPEVQGGIATATSTRAEGFAAINGRFM
jgi:hypothetical protein